MVWILGFDAWDLSSFAGWGCWFFEPGKSNILHQKESIDFLPEGMEL
jgi:hypothetical protein